MNIVLLGGPGAGKGTQSEFIIEEFGMLHISTGDVLREAVANKTPQGIEAKKYMDSGDLVPDETIVGIMNEKLSTMDLSKGIILDGFPRTVEQAKALDKIMESIDNKLDLVIFIDTPEDVVIDRLCSRRMCKECGFIGSVLGLDKAEIAEYKCPKCGGEMYQREDDNEATVKNRIKVYTEETSPLIDYYKNQNKLVRVDGAVESSGSNNAKEVYGQVRKYLLDA